VKIPTTRFGEVEVSDDAVITFPKGILGFPAEKEYVMFDGPEGSPFKWLQAVRNPDIAFIICDPRIFKPDYVVGVTPHELEELEIAAADDGVVCVIMFIPEDPRRMTANLLGPLVFNAEKRIGRQLVLTNPEYSTKHLVLQPGTADKNAGGENADTETNPT